MASVPHSVGHMLCSSSASSDSNASSNVVLEETLAKAIRLLL